VRILVLRGGAIGDFLVTLPALQLLRGRWPDARIELVGHVQAGALAVSAGVIDAVHSQHEARWSALFGDGALPGDLAAMLAAYDLVLNYWPDADGALARRFPLRPGQQYLSAPAQPAVAPAARHFCEPLRTLGLSTDDFRSRLRLPSANDLRPATSDVRLTSCDLGPSTSDVRLPGCDLGLSTRDLRPTVALHPGSGSPRKNWPVDRWAAVCARLPGPLLIVGGEADTVAVEALARFGRTALCRPLSALAVALSRCRLLVGHDSGISHLAAAVGTPCVLLFGPTDPAMWAPPGDHVRVLRRGTSLEAIGVDEVLAEMPHP